MLYGNFGSLPLIYQPLQLAQVVTVSVSELQICEAAHTQQMSTKNGLQTSAVYQGGATTKRFLSR